MPHHNEGELKPVWTAVGNIVKQRPYGHDGQHIRNGTKHFSPGTKVYIIDWYPGLCENIMVVGPARESRRFIKVVVRVDWVENFRVQQCYKPSALKKFYDHYAKCHLWTEERALDMCETLPFWQKGLGEIR